MAEVLAVEWRVPSAELIPIMARLIIRDDLYAVRPTINALAVVTEANVAGAAAELGCSLDDELAGRLTDLFRDLWTDKPGSLLDKLQQKDLAHFADGYVPKAELEALLARMSMSEKELEKWLGALLAAVGREHVRRNLITAIERSKADDRSGCLAILDALIQTYPGFAPARWERAIHLDTSGESRAAWNEIVATLLLDSCDGLIWQSAGVILKRLGFGDDAAAAAAISYVIKQGSEA